MSNLGDIVSNKHGNAFTEQVEGKNCGINTKSNKIVRGYSVASSLWFVILLLNSRMAFRAVTAELKMEVLRERELRETLEKQLLEEQRTRS
ncbi:hypothetical protein CEXT_404161 [Caerostris extrusa]|uniref:Uncharacterized protein n=1 Tax=Caerostris extrusa TaxID=172846 RepID=A0AAV4S2J5_CAEEX|nr:hypothetical protein CEXT_404161 [Caerostris extrusa]